MEVPACSPVVLQSVMQSWLVVYLAAGAAAALLAEAAEETQQATPAWAYTQSHQQASYSVDRT